MVEDNQIKAQVSPFAIRKGEIKVFDGERDFHFIRENICGNWSQKIGRSELIEKSSYIDVPNNYDLIKILKI